jgi:hypothetical protein
MEIRIKHTSQKAKPTPLILFLPATTTWQSNTFTGVVYTNYKKQVFKLPVSGRASQKNAGLFHHT